VAVVGCRGDDDPIRHREDEAAVPAGVENLLLGATAAGLASFWSSPPVVVARRPCAFAGFLSGSALVAVVDLGWPASPPPSPPRTEAQSPGSAFPPTRPEAVDGFGTWIGEGR